jgi:hypothetical protein
LERLKMVRIFCVTTSHHLLTALTFIRSVSCGLIFSQGRAGLVMPDCMPAASVSIGIGGRAVQDVRLRGAAVRVGPKNWPLSGSSTRLISCQSPSTLRALVLQRGDAALHALALVRVRSLAQQRVLAQVQRGRIDAAGPVRKVPLLPAMRAAWHRGHGVVAGGCVRSAVLAGLRAWRRGFSGIGICGALGFWVA